VIKRKENASFFRRHLRTILGIVVIALAIHDVFGPHGFLAMRRTQVEIERFSAEMQQLNKDNQELTDEVTSLKTDPQLIERIAREDMGLARPGEMIFKLPASQDGPPTTDPGKPR